MDAPPDDLIALRAALAQAQAKALAAEQLAAAAQAKLAAVETDTQAQIAALKLLIEKLQRELYGQRSERKARLLDQLELELEELEASASEDELAAEQAAAQTTSVTAFARKRPSRQPFPDHLPRERVVIPAPTTCPCCGSSRLSRLGETVTESAERVPASHKIIQTVREKVSCRDCERISQAPAPFHVTPRGWAGPNLLASILVDKFAHHLPLNRQCERFARERLHVSLSTAADQVGHACATLKPLHTLLERHVLTADRLHGDDTTVPVLAKGKTDIARLWVYLRDDRPFAGPAPPAALFYYSRDRSGIHPEQHLAGYTGLLQADAYAGYDRLYDPARKPAPVTDALCWAHARRKFFELADIATKARRGAKAPEISPVALEAVKRIDGLFDLERTINGLPTHERLAVRQDKAEPLVDELESWMRQQRAAMSRHATVAKALDYMLTRWERFARFLTDGRLCLTNNAAERALRGVALGRRAWMFAGSDRGGQRAAFMYSLMVSAKLNDIDPQAWLADVLARINDLPQTRLHELLPWEWKQRREAQKATAA
ncbi:IS66 family transposase [Niveispirillum lacus]|uniref:IS66 family transposase n=1 Tax=Niveispirillum lacus TaxID=1981099 RepID=A0A255Z865_9PROT|nr:IS66 family transposase [Niveispirillum lacus]OYQ37094.1 IS66 family transposase [Niveispirillum lacus]